MPDQDNGQPLTPATISWTPSEEKKSKRAKWITRRISLMLASYRRDNTPNPDGYLAAIGLVFERYTDALITTATDPVQGITTEERWRSFPPTAGELRAWLEQRQSDLARPSAYQRRVEQQLAEREALQRLHDTISIEERKAQVERIEDEMAKHGMFMEGWKRRQREAEIARTRAVMAASGTEKAAHASAAKDRER